MTGSVRDQPLDSARKGAALLISVYGLYYALVFPYASTLYTAVHLGMMLFLYGLGRLSDVESRLSSVVDVAVLLTITVTTIYIGLNFGVIRQTRAITGYTSLDLLMVVPVIGAVAWYTKTEYGNILLAVILGAIVYAYFGSYFPGIFKHTGLPLQRLVELSALNFSGAYGRLTRISALWIFIFMIWAGFLREYGDVDAFLDLAYLVGKSFKSGVYQIAVIGSMFVGAVMGTPAGNIVITGNISIPIMKDNDILPERAAAIESVASTGGMVLPPIMGSAAFIMATLTQTPYSDIIVFAAIPAVLLYLTLVISVHLTVLRDRRRRPDDGGADDEGADDEVEYQREVDRTGIVSSLIPVITSVAVLTYTLIALRYGPTLAGVWTIGVYLGTRIVVMWYHDGLDMVFELFDSGVSGLVAGAEMMAPITIVLASMNMVLSLVGATGLPLTLSIRAVELSGGILAVALVIVMVVTIIFGMGMPISAAYLLGVTLMEPMLLNMGLSKIIIHFYIVYWAMVSTISPPVALGCAIASNIAQADFFGTVKESLIIGVPYFLLPFSFVFYQHLLLIDGTKTLVSFGIVLVSILLIMIGLQQAFRSLVVRVGLVAAGVAIFVGGTKLPLG